MVTCDFINYPLLFKLSKQLLLVLLFFLLLGQLPILIHEFLLGVS